jgi:hypothetical protein
MATVNGGKILKKDIGLIQTKKIRLIAYF